MPHLSAISHPSLAACRAIIKADKQLGYSRSVSERKIESLLNQDYIFAKREILLFLDRLFSGERIQSFDPVITPKRSFNQKTHSWEQEQSLPNEPLGEDDES